MEIIDLKAFSKEKVVDLVVEALGQGKLIVYPTDTVYGVAVDATNDQAVEKLLKYKGKQFNKPIPIAVSSEQMAEKYVELNVLARNLYRNFLPGPVTVVSTSTHQTSPYLESPLGTLGVRIIDSPLMNDIISTFGKAITTTSASVSTIKPYSVSAMLDSLPKGRHALIDLILDAGELPRAEPSMVVDTTLNQQFVVRSRSDELGLLTQDSVVTSSPEDTIAFGKTLIEKFANYLNFKSVVVALSGELGAGKTHLTKGIAQGMGINEPIQSPTFILEREYSTNKGKKLYHLDVWRLQHYEELEALRLQEKIEQGNVFVIEWADRVSEFFDDIKDEAIILWIEIIYGTDLNERNIKVSTRKQ